MTAVVSAYLFVAPEMLALNEMVSYALSLAVMAVAGGVFVQYKTIMTQSKKNGNLIGERQ